MIKYIGHALALLLLMGSLSSCVDNKVVEEPETVITGRVLSLDVAIPYLRAGEGDVNNEYEAGVDFENYIDLSYRGIRIYIFGSDNKFLTRLIPLGNITADNSGGRETYTVSGVLPEDFPATSSFKIVVLANWPVYTDELIPGVTTIDDLCNAEYTKFNRLTDFHLSSDNNIPFFGIHEYTNVTVKAGETTLLPEPITLLRAMAKVEVVLDNEVITLDDVAIRGINARGYCAPAGVYSQSDYDHNGQWSEDYVKDLHLPGGANDAGQGRTSIPLYRKYARNGAQKETWVCYVPEYRNTSNADGSANYKSRLELRFDYQEATEAPSTVYFADYKDGKLVEGSDFDIHRNNLYRFTVKVGLSGLIIRVRKWEAAYDNEYIFD